MDRVVQYGCRLKSPFYLLSGHHENNASGVLQNLTADMLSSLQDEYSFSLIKVYETLHTLKRDYIFSGKDSFIILYYLLGELLILCLYKYFLDLIFTENRFPQY